MAQVASQSIVVGGSRIVGVMSVDGGAVRGESGPLRPQLVVPLKIEMSTAPAEAPLAVCAVRAFLSTNAHPSPRTAIGTPTTDFLIDGFFARSLPTGHPEHTLELRFAMNAAEIESLEHHRHSTDSDLLQLHLVVEPVVVGFQTFNEIRPGEEAAEVPWDRQLGLMSQLFPFWDVRVHPLGLAIEHSSWLRDVLPGLGYDRSRLIELTFPPSLPNHAAAATQFDKARRALDQRRYDDCISECRGLLNMWEKQLGATKTDRVAVVVARERGWSEQDFRAQLLDALWKEVGDAVNASHHPESSAGRQTFDYRDARLVLLLTVALSEYVG